MTDLNEELMGLRGEMRDMKDMLKVLVEVMATSFISPADFSEKINMDRRRVIAHLNSGLIKGKKIQGEWRIPMTEIARLLNDANGNHYTEPVRASRRNNLILKSNEPTTRKAKRTAK